MKYNIDMEKGSFGEKGDVPTRSGTESGLEKMPSFEQHMIDMRCERYFGRNSDRMAREFQLLGLIEGYKRWGFDEENAKIHKRILKEVANGGVKKRLEGTFYEDGSLKTMSVELDDGSVLTEQRIYPEMTPELNIERIHKYREEGIIDVNDSFDIIRAFTIMMGKASDDMDDVQAKAFRERLGKIKDKIIAYYNRQYQEAISGNDKHAREGGASFTEIEGDGGAKIPVTILKGAKFGFLVHVRNAMHTVQGEMSKEQLQSIDPQQEWNKPRDGKRIPNGLSTSFINSDKINLFYQGEIIFGFTDISQHPIVTMGYEDIGSSVDAHSRFSIVGSHGNEAFMSPAELIEKTGTGYSHFNELAIDRYSRDGKIIQPSCLIVFGKDENAITPLQKKYAERFRVPIYVIDPEKYGGINKGFEKEEENEE